MSWKVKRDVPVSNALFVGGGEALTWSAFHTTVFQAEPRNPVPAAYEAHPIIVALSLFLFPDCLFSSSPAPVPGRKWLKVSV